MKIICLDQDARLAHVVAGLLGCECFHPEQRYFPDGEHYLRFPDGVENQQLENEDVIIFANLHQPDEKILPLIFTAGYLREIGVKRIVLITPYLSYMRQDVQFHSGECVTSRYFAKLLSDHFDGLITIDPHLHRYHSLDEIYSIPSIVIHAPQAIAKWIKHTVDNPIIIGPDDESRQWAEEVAKLANCPVTVLQKTRLGDRDVRIQMEHNEKYSSYQPILVDDIISTGKTVIETARLMAAEGLKAPIVIGVHAVLAQGTENKLDRDAASELDQAVEQSLLARWVTCNTIPHLSNDIDLSSEIATAIHQFLNKEDI